MTGNKAENTDLKSDGDPIKPEEGAHPVEAHKAVTAKNALQLLKAGVEGEKARKGTKKELEIAGKKVVDPERAYQNMQEAFRLVRTYFGKHLKINLDDLQFKQFHGHMVGESKKEGTFVDPIMLMHPAMRLAHVIAHELAHRNKKVMNEGLVEGYIQNWFGYDKAEHRYEEAVEKFKEFAMKFNKNGDIRKTTEKIYELYYTHRYEKLYQQYAKNYIKGLKTEKEKDEAYKLFREVFPELQYMENGKFSVKHGEKGAVKGDNVVSIDDYRKKAEGKEGKVGAHDEKGAGGKGAEVISMDAFRKKVAETEKHIKKTGTEE